NQIQCAPLKGWRGSVDHAGWRKLSASVAALAGGEERERRAAPVRRAWSTPRVRWLAVASVLLLVVGAFAAMQFLGGGENKRPVIAVLPFESFDKGDESLVAGIWEDTRQAIGRNPQLTVLGPNTAEEIARKGSGTARKLADYLVEASIRSTGDRIRVSANLVRTRDGTEVWNKSFDRKLDDVFALQSEIAGEIEGHIRGRLAERGGVRPENIATSGEAYALYSEARATLRRRDSLGYEEARAQLSQVVKMDPSFAPGWASLSLAVQLYGPSLGHLKVGFSPRQAEAHARRAIALAPNLAAGHSALGFALRKGPAAEAALQRAIALDPGDFESNNWLATIYLHKDQPRRALELYSRAVEIEPLFWPAVVNKLNLLLDLGETRAAEQERQRLQALGNPLLSALAGIQIAQARSDLSEAARIGVELLRTHPKETRGIVGFPLFGVLLQLGLTEEARRAFPPPPFGPPLLANDPKGLDIVEQMGLQPEQLFALNPLPMNVGRVYLLSGRGATFAKLYRQAADSPEEMIAITGSDSNFAMLAPFIALALQKVGDREEAARVLAAAEQILTNSRIDRRRGQLALLARVHAVQGRGPQALAELSDAVRRGWLPSPPQLLTDIALDPAFESIKTDRRFLAARQRILGHLAKERAELGPVRID
ncbi:MAG TPA: tetratricopeptide repeat protein, partial [Sphingomicrobium sp.]|nr:tetratricopeptide repeat protein [Sphingomicrobium sp.]